MDIRGPPLFLLCVLDIMQWQECLILISSGGREHHTSTTEIVVQRAMEEDIRDHDRVLGQREQRVH
jgi:hypothetical protein